VTSVVIVDDKPQIRDGLRMILELAGHTASTTHCVPVLTTS